MIRKQRRFLAVGAIGLLLGLVAACGGDDQEAQPPAAPPPAEQPPAGEPTPPAETAEPADTGASEEPAGGAEEAQTIVEQAASPVTFEPPGPAFDASSVEGKTIALLMVNLGIPFQADFATAFEEATDAAGAELIVYDAKGQVSEATRALEQAVAQGVDVIVDNGVDEELIRPQLQDALDAGIPVVDALAFDPGPLPTDISPAIVAGGGHCYSCAGELLAAFVVADSGGEANVMMFTSSDVGLPADNEAQGFADELARLCPDCTLDTTDVKIPEWNTLTSLVPTILSRDPDINYLFPLFDGQALFAAPAVTAAGAEDRVKIVSFNGTPAALELIQTGDVMAADVGSASAQQGWAIADQTFRVLTGTPPSEDTHVWERLFIEENVATIDLTQPEETWYGGPDFRAEFLTLWGLG